MKYIFGFYSSSIKPIQDIADELSKSMQEFTGNEMKLHIEVKVFEMAMTTSRAISLGKIEIIKNVLKEQFEKFMKDKKFTVKLERTEYGTR
jgi:hypothetical protein